MRIDEAKRKRYHKIRNSHSGKAVGHPVENTGYCQEDIIAVVFEILPEGQPFTLICGLPRRGPDLSGGYDTEQKRDGCYSDPLICKPPQTRSIRISPLLFRRNPLNGVKIQLQEFGELQNTDRQEGDRDPVNKSLSYIQRSP